jgi:hypothetical protein
MPPFLKYMGNKSHHTFKKNEREKSKRQKKADKLARKTELRKSKSESLIREDGIDPDIAGIIPGPQVRSEEA